MLNSYAVGTIQYTSMIVGSFNSHNKPQNKFPHLHLIDKKNCGQKVPDASLNSYSCRSQGVGFETIVCSVIVLMWFDKE